MSSHPSSSGSAPAPTLSPPSRWGAGRALLLVEAFVGLAVVAAIVGKTYGSFPTLTFVLCAAAVAFTVWVSSRMLTSLGDATLEVAGRVRDFDREKLEGEKRLLLQGIKDLEIDRQTEKMSEAEYLRLRQTAETRAIEIIRTLRESDDHWSNQAETLVYQRLGEPPPQAVPPPEGAEPSGELGPSSAPIVKANLPAAHADVFESVPALSAEVDGYLVCGACNHLNDQDARFCANCGRPLHREEAA